MMVVGDDHSKIMVIQHPYAAAADDDDLYYLCYSV
jgi:hypothetical protein